MPHVRADFLSGQICAVLANIHRTKEAKVFGPADFLPQFAEDVEEIDTAEEEPPLMIDIEATSKALELMLGKKE